ncbi:hypothetical protein RUND412_007913 [Rhizina undulata]
MASANYDRSLEPDPDCASDSGDETDTTSLISSAINHTFENGRRYHGYKAGNYVLPNDEKEQNRMDLLHHCCLLALHGNSFMAPVGKDWKPQRILDLGTGSGLWAIDVADQYPHAGIVGVDLSAIQPNWVPTNVTFEVDDIEETWQYHDNSFDFIHIRNMAGSVTDWKKLYRQAFKALKPGGWIEVQEFSDPFSTNDGSLPRNSALWKWFEYFEKGCALSGRDWNIVAPGIKTALEEVGCVQVVEQVLKFPIGRWPKGRGPKDLGTFWRQQFVDHAEGISMALFTRVLGWETKAVHEYLVDVISDLKNPKHHVYSDFYCTYGRKPSA